MDDRAKAIQTARKWMKDDPLFLDTETTGLDGQAEICELSVIDAGGSVLMDTLIRPLQPISCEVTSIHGITDTMAAEAPTFADVLPELQKALYRRNVIIYNVTYDVRLIKQSARAHGLNPDVTCEAWHCAMRLYAQFYGKWSEKHNTYHWQQLGNAARQCGIDLPRHLHRARVDAELTRQIVKHIADDEKDHRQLSVSFKMFYEEHKESEEIRAKRKQNARRSREAAERLLQLKEKGLPLDEIMEMLRREFPV